MAAPTQEYPSWLTQVVTTITDDSGNPVTTSSTVVFLPLTYYGPSIPLGPDWTYGGLTSPASTATATETSATIPTTSPETSIPPTTTATPTSSIPSTSAIPSSTNSASSSLSPSSSTPTPSSSSSSNPASISHTGSPTSSSSSTAAPTSNGGLERGQLVGIIVGSILGAIAIFLLALICCLRRRRRSVRSRSISPIDSEPVLINVEDARYSPRASGEEADALLQPSADSRGRRRAGANTGSLPSSHSSGASGYGTVLDKPTIAVPESPMEEDRYDRPLHPWQLHSLEEEDSVLPPDDDEYLGHAHTGEYAALGMALPPRLVDQNSQASIQTRRTQRSSYPMDGDEPAMLATARRVRVDGPRTSPETRNLPLEPSDAGSPPRAGRGSGGLLGLTGLAGLGRFSWFNNLTASSRANSDRDMESGTALLSDAPPEMTEHGQARLGVPIGLGLMADGSRPLSNVSAKSNNSAATVYHDAQSSLSSTPGLRPPPRALASSSQGELGVPPSAWSAQGTSYFTPQALVDVDPLSEPVTSPHGAQSHSLHNGSDIDILDLPAPRGISPFSSSGSTKIPSLRDPAQAIPTPKAWDDTMGHTPSLGSFAGQSDGSGTQVGHGISIDVLEEEPPAPGDIWKSMASVLGMASSSLGMAGNRTTFGMPNLVNQPSHNSEQGSLHSMRSHLSPNSSRSAGSAPASRRDPSDGTGSSQSHPRSKSTMSGSSLAHSGSISSDGRLRRGGRGGPISPALSAFGHTSPVSSPEPAHITDLEPGHASVFSGSQGHSPSDRSHSRSPPLSPLLMSPWAGGLDRDWEAA